jgi:hypothetical protein
MGGLCSSAFSGRSAELHERHTVRQGTVGLQVNDKPQTWESLNAPAMHIWVGCLLDLMLLENELCSDATPGNVNRSFSASINLIQ